MILPVSPAQYQKNIFLVDYGSASSWRYFGYGPIEPVVLYFWYSPYLFLRPWAEGLNKQVNELNQSHVLPFVSAAVGAFLSCYVLSWLFQLVGVETIRDGASAGIVLWLGIALPVFLSHYILAGISFYVLYIDALNALFSLVVTGSILAVWRKR